MLTSVEQTGVERKPRGLARGNIWRASLTLILAALYAASPLAATGERRLGTISGIVSDNQGRPLAGAIVSLLREGAEVVLKQTRTAADGRFSARIAPGRYVLRAVAAGFTEVSFPSVQVSPSQELVYRFNLEPVGSGRTAPERRKDHDSSKWILRSKLNRRSIFQAQENEDETVIAMNEAEPPELEPAEDQAARQVRGVIETFAAASASPLAPGYAGVNFALEHPLSERFDLIFAGQIGAGPGAPQRLEATVGARVNDQHYVSVSAAGMQIDPVKPAHHPAADGLGQLSLRAVDQWVVRNGVVVVLGLDYSRFVGAGGAASLSPRLGVQFDAGARMRVRAAYAPGGDAERAQSVAEFEDERILFREPVSRTLAVADGRAVMERSRRLELGVERVLDNRSSVEATAFFDTTSGRGVGLFSAPVSAFAGAGGAMLLTVANQEGAARGLRVVYARRLNSKLKASAGYSFGRGQKLSPGGPTRPADLFSNELFQTAAAQVDADLPTGTRVRTVFRFSPRATVFAIDPFAGRLAVYDPSLSILVTQALPTFGLPVQVEALIDARNLLDTQTSADDGETLLFIGTMRRSVRGGISVRF
jgi:hypothetical protein